MHTSPFIRQRSRRVTVGVCALLWVVGSALWTSSAVVRAQQPNFMTGFSKPEGPPSNLKPEQLKEVSFRQRLDDTLPLDARFKDEYGRDVTLGKYFGGERPVILAFVYYRCPMLCTQVMNGISASLRALTGALEAGHDFDVVLVSFDPKDSPSDALEKKRLHLEYWRSENKSGAWHLLTGNEASIKRVTSAAGFTYQWDPVTGQFAHASGVLVVTPQGKLSRYFYGVEYSPKELRMALVESGQGKIGSAIDELLLFCYHYDPVNGRYGAAVMNLVRAGGVLTLVAMATYFMMSRRRDSRVPLEGRV
jgi:protein SCO1